MARRARRGDQSGWTPTEVDTSGAGDGRDRVAIFGAGPGGLSAALELAERGFQVDLYEKSSWLGGKSRSETLPGTGTGGRRDLPLENGPHLYWGTYQHWNDTLARVPTDDGSDSVLANIVTGWDLVRPTLGWLTRLPWRAPLVEAVRHLMARGLKVSELPRVVTKLVALATSGLLRQHLELDGITFVDYTGPMSRKSFESMAGIVGQVKVAPDLVSARETARNLHVFSGQFGAKGLGRGARAVVGVTKGAADGAVYAPFGRRLEKLGVRLHMGDELTALTFTDGAIGGARVRVADGQLTTVRADWYILAVPQDIAQQVLSPEIIAAEPRLGNLDRLGEQWLGAINLFLKGPKMPSAGSLGPWQAVAVDYGAYTPDFPAGYGDGTAGQWFSVDLQTWDYPGLLYGKTAKECSKDEFLAELLAHLAYVCPSTWGKLDESDIVAWDVSRLLDFEPGRVINREPLFGAEAGAWGYQPRAVTAIDNLFIGATYARTTGGIDSMDSACEAARRSVNAILDRTNHPGARAFVDTYASSGLLKRVWAYDDRRYRKGLPNRFDVIKPYRPKHASAVPPPVQYDEATWPESL
ncbi:FAD-dependent oxidoreductase [Mycolicibacter minnesotensis]